LALGARLFSGANRCSVLILATELALDVTDPALSPATAAWSVRLSAAKASCIDDGLLAALLPLVGLMIKREIGGSTARPKHSPPPRT